MIGHEQVRTYLERQLPVATLLHGPASIGKWTLANHVAEHHKVTTWDRWPVEYGFNIDTVRLIQAFAARPPVGRFKLILASLDGAESRALNALLKTIEEPPPTVRFIFTSTAKTLPTVASRCTVFELGILTSPQLQDIYQQQGLPVVKARRAATYAKGQVARGYGVDIADEHRTQVITLAKSLAAGDRTLFHSAFKTWDDRATELFTILLTESLTHRWHQFTETDTGGLHLDRRRLWQMVSAVTRLPAARPRLGVRAALEPFVAR